MGMLLATIFRVASHHTKEKRSGQQQILKLLSASPAMRISGPLFDQTEGSVVAAALKCSKPSNLSRGGAVSSADRPNPGRT